jgi:hypothetical protein
MATITFCLAGVAPGFCANSLAEGRAVLIATVCLAALVFRALSETGAG